MKKTRFCSLEKILIVCLILFSTNDIWGQNNQDDFGSHMRYGGGIGLSFGDGFFSGSISPSAIYQFDNQFAMGVGLSGTYSSLKNRYTSTIIGGSLIGLYNVIPEIQLSAEFEESYITRNYKYDGFQLNENYWYPALFLGVGFQSNNFTVGIRYDVLYNRDKSIYAAAYAPFVRVYF